MRTNQPLPGSSSQRISGGFVKGLPLEWLDARSWRLPSGKALAEFALQAGFLAPLLLRPDHPKSSDGLLSGATTMQPKHLRKGASR